MPPRPTKPKSMFLGPHYRFFDPIVPGTCTLQFHNLLPGQHWNPVDGARAQQPFILGPYPTKPVWYWKNSKFFIAFSQQRFLLRIQGYCYDPIGRFFILHYPLAIFSPGYNEVHDGTGLLAYGGTVTCRWSGVQPQ